MTRLRILIFVFLSCIFKEYTILDAANTNRKISNIICLSPECKKAASIMLQNMDPKVAPCDDFYKFACGNFIKTTLIPDDKPQVSRYDLVHDKIQEQLKISIEEKIQPNEPRSITLAKNFYKACMNTTAIEKTGLRTVLGELKEVGGWPVLEADSWKEENFDWKQSIYELQKFGYGTDYLFTFKVATDYLNNTKRVLNIDQTPLAVDREYLVKGFQNEIVRAYYDYMIDIAVIFGANRARAEKELKESLEFEIKLANISTGEEDRVNTTTLNNPMTVKELSKIYPSIPWKEYFNSILKSIIVIDDNEVIIVSEPTFFEKFEKLIKKTPKRVLANYLLWRAVQEDDVDYLTAEVRNRKIKFETVLTGHAETQPRWKECLHITSGPLGLSVGALYVRKYFTQKSKKSAERLASDIERQFKRILKEFDWMDKKTRKSALYKLKSMKKFIGYPDELFDNKILDEFFKKVEITPNDFLQAASNMSFFWTHYFFTQLRKPVDRADWTSHGSTANLNALYSLQENSIEIPAGILQDVFFNKNRPQYLNFAGIGLIIGQEISQGFDDEGGQYDKSGNFEDWWSAEAKTKYFEKADCITKQYENYTVEEVGLKLNGNNTQGMNIADNVGLKVSYLAYQNWVKRNRPEPKLPGLNYSQPQLFWISAAIHQCTKYVPEFLQNFITTDNHSPAEFRVIGSFSHRPEFARDFNCPLGSKMNPVKKCTAW